jgi:hypothetical protein
VTVSDTTAVSFEYVATTVDILSTSFDSTLELSHTYQSTKVPVMTSFETNDMHVDTKSYMSSSEHILQHQTETMSRQHHRFKANFQ